MTPATPTQASEVNHLGGGIPAFTPLSRATIALVGNPNVGKSTLFNTLTGSRRHVGNWPGTTVEIGHGPWRIDKNTCLEVLDLPGTYSLDPLSPDEQLTRTLLVDVPESERPDCIVVVIDASDIARGLYLLSQIREHAQRVVVALTMIDRTRHQGTEINVKALQDFLDVPVITLDPRRRTEVNTLAPAVSAALSSSSPKTITRVHNQGPRDDLDLADTRFTWISEVIDGSVRYRGSDVITWSDRIDRVVTSAIAGPFIFLAVMWALFHLTTAGAAPIINALDHVVSGPVTRGAADLLAYMHLSGTWVEGLILDGVIAGVGMIITFIPLMAIMFVLLALLENSGYLARAAVVSDRLMRAIGLPGRAVVPLVVGFGCNVPAISATRVLPDARHRLLTALIVPFTSCSARLPVYVLVSAALFGQNAGTVVFGMYLASIVMVIVGGFLLRLTFMRNSTYDPLVLDLPRYQVPFPRIILAMTWMRLAAFLRTATSVILITIIAIWVLSSIPTHPDKGGFGNVRIEDSAFAAVASVTAPVLAPAGLGDWHITGALISGFVAKEAVVSSWAQTYATQEPGNLRKPGGLGESLRADFDRSSGGHPQLAGVAFLLFLLAYTPCTAVIATQIKEIGWRWTVVGIGLGITVAWTTSVLVFQIGRLFL